MKKSLFFIVFILSIQVSFAQKNAEAAIDKIMADQVVAWNKGDLESFMQGYWQSDELKFIGKNGITYGWKKTLENYQKNYPDRKTMGELSFEILVREKQESNHYFVVGKWKLKREIGDIGGHFSLIFRKIKGKWLIVSDHSS